MKCFVLAGGNSERLWPLARKDYPKQFMEIRDHRSMFQETIVRNLPFCEEFVIFSSRQSENIIRGQLRYFQHLKYSFVFEDENAAKGTALPVVMQLLRCERDDKVLIVATDSLIDGDYNKTIVDLNHVISEKKIAVVGCEPIDDHEGYNFLQCNGGVIESFTKESFGSNYLLDCGIMGGEVSVFLESLDPAFLKKCKRKLDKYSGVITEEVSDGFGRQPFSSLLQPSHLQLIHATFEYSRIIDLFTYNEYKGKKEKKLFELKEESKDVDVVNTEDGKSVILNDVSDLLVVNTRDALYISSRKHVADIKKIMNEHNLANLKVFNESSFQYETWGYKETLYLMPCYKFLKEVVYPKCEIPMHSHTRHTTIINVAQGIARITINGKKKEYAKHSSLFIPIGQKYRVENTEESDLILMVTRMGEGLLLDDYERDLDEVLVKLTPCLKECIWGGTEIGKVFKKNLGGKQNIGESWELSTHPVGESTVADGKYQGKTLRQFIDIIGRDKLGWKAQSFNDFPLLIKFIDSHDKLSIQVHPNDEYAFPHENQYGKNEMWYIVSAKPDAYIYAGFNRAVTRQEVEDRIKNNTIEEILQKIPVSAGQTYFLKAGTVHAIGAGCVICEIQQSSNVTYRLYDYDRMDQNGNKRELHIAQSLDVLNYDSSLEEFNQNKKVEQFQCGTKEVLGECKYFTATKYTADKNLKLSVDFSSFVAFVVLDGKGRIADENGISRKTFKKGDTFFGIAQNYLMKSKGGFAVIAVTL